MNYRSVLIAGLCIALVAVAGCTGFSRSDADHSSASKEVAMSESGLKTAYDARIGYTANGAVMQVPNPVQGPGYLQSHGGAITDAKIVRTAYLDVEVKDVAGSIETIRSLVLEKGGYVSSTNIQKTSNDRLSGSVIIRIPATEFEVIVSGVKAVGTVRSVSTQAEDVTEEYIDLLAQQASYQNQLAQYNAIMKQSQKVEDIIKVQEQIDRVQTELDRLNGRLKYLNSRIDYSTITVSLQEPEPVGGETGHTFVGAINTGIAGFFGMIDAIIIILFSLIPLLVLGGAAYGIYRWKKGKTPKDPSIEMPGKN